MNRKELRQKVYDKYGGHCAYCGKKIAIEDVQIDHIVPIRRGDTQQQLDKYDIQKGADDISNYNPSCRSCNFRKGVYSIEQFREEIRKQCKGIMKRSFQVRQSMDYGLLEYYDKPIVFYFEKFKNKL